MYQVECQGSVTGPPPPQLLKSPGAERSLLPLEDVGLLPKFSLCIYFKILLPNSPLGAG